MLSSPLSQVRYGWHEANDILYSKGDLSTCWYILLAGSVFIDGSMYLPRWVSPVDGRKIIWGPLWSRTTKNPDVSTGPLAPPFIFLLTPLTPELVGKSIIRWLFCCFYFLFWTIVHRLSGDAVGQMPSVVFTWNLDSSRVERCEGSPGWWWSCSSLNKRLPERECRLLLESAAVFPFSLQFLCLYGRRFRKCHCVLRSIYQGPIFISQLNYRGYFSCQGHAVLFSL